jgi:hypothetical protein
MDWFRHDTDANLDEKLQEVLLDYGLDGYGLYWYCIELIISKISAENISFELKHDARVIARNTGSTPQRVEEMMNRFVQLGLFENFNKKITCYSAAKRLVASSTSSAYMRTLIKKIKENPDIVKILSDSVMTISEKVITPSDAVMTPSDFISSDNITIHNSTEPPNTLPLGDASYIVDIEVENYKSVKSGEFDMKEEF